MVLWFDDLMRLTKPRCVGILPRLLSPQAQALREFVCLMGRLNNVLCSDSRMHDEMFVLPLILRVQCHSVSWLPYIYTVKYKP